MLTWSACSEEDQFLNENNREQTVTFRPVIKQDMHSRAIGDAAGINRLKVAVYEVTETLTKKFILTKDWANAQANDIALTLIEGHTYNILFWAENKDNTAYNITDDGSITVSYDDYMDGGFAKMEEMDAFYGTATVTVGSSKNEHQGDITLSRPLAQLNFTDKATQPITGTHQTVVTFHSIPTAFNPFTGTVEITEDVNQTFTFKDYLSETLSLNGVTYYYVSSNYLFAPVNGEATIKATLDLQLLDGTSINRFVFDGNNGNKAPIALKQNMKTNVYGNIVEQPQTLSIWDGTTKTRPDVDTEDSSRYLIDEASDIAWLSVETNSSTLENNKTFFLTTNIDMAGKDNLSSIQLPSGSTVDGDGHTIKGMILDNAVFGDARSVSIQNLTVEETHINNTNTTETTHVGILLNTLDGSATFTNVTVKNSTASTSKGAAGGIVGYIKRTGSEPLNVVFDNCHVTETTIEGTHSEGHFVGLLRGYDNGETLTFNDNCTSYNIATSRAEDYTSPYTEGNEGAWLAGNNYSKFNGWLGNEECYRGKVYYGANRFIPKWDGVTKITPLTDGTTKLIYSAFDLANCAGTNPGIIKFMEDVDLGAKVFNPLTNISKLLGEGKTIYNMKVETTFNTNSWDGGGFIRRCSAATIENITFKNADVKVTHVTGSDGDAYASIVCGTAEGNNTMTNVKVVGGKLYGCNKMGGIAGYITGTFNATNCTVDGLSIENYDSGGKDNLGFKANGEVGGAFGFIAANSTISGCYVKNTTLNCIGVNNGRVLAFFKYAGRHVNEFIGDIRTTSGQKITITYDETQFAGNVYKNRKDQYSGCKYIGHCYYTSILTINDTQGTVYVNNKSITVAKNY